jgi:hypothetical protein
MQNNFVAVRTISPPFDPANWIAKKYRLPIARARLIVELAGFSGQPDLHVGSTSVFGRPTR